jgi:hypothetical protein
MGRNNLFETAIICLLICCSFTARAEEKEKKISRSIKAGSAVLLSIDNQFGKVHVNTNNGNTIQVDITIKAEDRNAEKTQEMLNKINVEIDDDPVDNLVSFETKLENFKNKNGAFSISYFISMPKSNPVEITNKFGDVYLGNTTAPVKLNVSYGNLVTEEINNNVSIKLAFASGSNRIKKMQNAEIDIKYSNLEMEECNDLELNDQFSKVNIGKVQELSLNSRYSDLTVGEAEIVHGEMKFSGLKLEQLNQQMNISVSYGKQFIIESINPTFKIIELDAQFTGVDLNLNPQIQAGFTADLKFGDLDYPKDKINMSYISKENTTNNYKGVIGNKNNPKSEIRIKASYGSVDLDFE